MLLTRDTTDSALSSLSAKQSTLTSRFQRALEMADRVDDSAMTGTATLLMNVIDAHRKLSNTINMQIIDSATSIVGIIMRFWENVGLSLYANMLSALTTIIKPSTAIYDQTYELTVSNLLSELLSVGDLIVESNVIVAWAMNGIYPTPGLYGRLKSLKGRLYDVSTLLSNYDWLLYTGQQPSSGYIPTNLIAGEFCVHTKNDLIDAINRFYLPLPLESVNSGYNSYYVTASETLLLVGNGTAFLEKAPVLRALMIQMSGCLKAYRRQLDDFSNWSNTSLQASFGSINNITPLSSLTSLFDTDYGYLVQLYGSYMTNEITKRELALLLGGLQGTVVLQNAETLVSDVEATVLTPLNDMANSMETSISAMMSELFTRLLGLQDFMSPSDVTIDKFARTTTIWQMPVIDLQDRQVGVRLLTTDRS